jgi:outer membrane protein assembly factor BamE
VALVATLEHFQYLEPGDGGFEPGVFEVVDIVHGGFSLALTRGGVAGQETQPLQCCDHISAKLPMFAHLVSRLSMSLAGVACIGLTACSSIDGATAKVVGLVTPYKMDIAQGNVVTSEQLALVKPGTTRAQVRDVLGTPLITSVFHGDRWDYVFTLKSQTSQSQVRRVAIIFKGDVVDRTESDPLPTETEFVATLKSTGTKDKAPPLEATEAALKKFPRPSRPETQDDAVGGAPVTYPPLEPSGK